LSILTGLLVLGTAVIIYFGADLRTASLYRSQRETRFSFLAGTMSYGIENIMVSSGSKEEVRRVVSGVLQRAMSADPSIAGCQVKREDGEIVYSFLSPGVDILKISSKTVPIRSGRRSMGTVTIYYVHKDLLEKEKMQQVVVIGTTVASMVESYMSRYEYFQVQFLGREIIEEDPDVLYSSISGPGGREIYSYRMEEFSEYVGGSVKERAERVSPVQPVIVQEIGYSSEYGRMVEVAVLVHDGSKRLGVVRIGYSMASLAEALARSRLLLSLVIFGATLTAFGIAIMLARGIARPLGELTEIARSIYPPEPGSEAHLENAERDIECLRMSFEKLGERLSARGDEVGRLATSFQDMIGNLEQYIGQLKSLYQRISIADRLYAMGQLSAGIAHEINNPLTIISTYTQMLLKRQDLEPELREELETIKEEISRISERVSELKSFSQESRFEYAPEDVNDVLDRTLGLCRYQIQKSGVRLESRLLDEEMPATIDAGKMRQVFLNLILNALHAMEESEEKRLEIRTAMDRERREILVTVADSGPGIDPEALPRIFDPFFTTKKPGSGTGLGLSICYNIVQYHGGSITIDTEPGRGTAFTVHIPMDKANEDENDDTQGGHTP